MVNYIGTNGDDSFPGTNDNDTIQGLQGDDTLQGGRGDDLYIYHLGDGNDTIYDRSSDTSGDSDTLSFTQNITQSSLTFSRDNNHLNITLSDGGTIFLQNQHALRGVEFVTFDNGAFLTKAEIEALLIAQETSNGNDSIKGFDYSDDTIEGGLGDDIMDGGYDNDTFIYNLGDGNDTIDDRSGDDDVLAFTAGITLSDINISRDDADITINIAGGGSILIDQQHLLNRGIERITFADGSELTKAEIEALLIAQSTSTGNDTIIGFDYSDDTLNGLAGNDIIDGLFGDDTLDGGLGRDTLTGGSGNDIFAFSDVTHSTALTRDAITDFSVTRDMIDVSALPYYDLDTDGGRTQAGELRIIYNENFDRTYVKSDQEDFIFFLEGNLSTSLSAENFTFASQTLLGGSADDLIDAGRGDDLLDGGLGKDKLIGDAGNDIFRFSDTSHSINVARDYLKDFSLTDDVIDISALPFYDFDTDGSFTESGELRLAYSAAADRTYVKSDQEDFIFFMDGDRTEELTTDHFIFAGQAITGDGTNNVLAGGAGDDTLDGGAGRDNLTGGEGNDIFVFSDTSHSDNANRDAIADFTIGEDMIDLSALAFTELDTDGGFTESGELRLIYISSSILKMQTLPMVH